MTSNDGAPRLDSHKQTIDEPEFATRTEAAYSRLHEAIVNGSLAPGQKLLLRNLIDETGFGASSLREALSRLVSDRLVRVSGQRGYWVEEISREAFEDILELRLLLEPEGLVRSVANATPDWEVAVIDAHEKLARVEEALDGDRDALGRQWELGNRAFHHALIQNCGSPWLLHFVEMLAEQSERYRRKGISSHAVPKEKLLAEHKAICDAALERNGPLAGELLKAHIRNSAKGLLAAVFPAKP